MDPWVQFCIRLLCSPEEYRPYLAYYVEGKGFFTPKWMPFGLTGAPTTFTHVTVQKLGDLLSKLNIELLVNDGGMAGDSFEDLLNCTRQFFVHVVRYILRRSRGK